MFRKFISNIIFIISLLCILWLCICYWASVTNPHKVPYLALASLTTAFAVLTNIFFALFWLFTKRKWRSLLFIMSLFIFRNMAFSVVGIHFAART